MPGARNWMMVTMKFTLPRSDDVINKTIPSSHMVWPVVAMSDRGGYDVQPELAAPPGAKKLASMTTPPAAYTQ